MQQVRIEIGLPFGECDGSQRTKSPVILEDNRCMTWIHFSQSVQSQLRNTYTVPCSGSADAGSLPRQPTRASSQQLAERHLVLRRSF